MSWNKKKSKSAVDACVKENLKLYRQRALSEIQFLALNYGVSVSEPDDEVERLAYEREQYRKWYRKLKAEKS